MAGEAFIELGKTFQQQGQIQNQALLQLKQQEDTLTGLKTALDFQSTEQEIFNNEMLQSGSDATGFHEKYMEGFNQRADAVLGTVKNNGARRILEGDLLRLKSDYQGKAQAFEFNKRIDKIKLDTVTYADDLANDTFNKPSNYENNSAGLETYIASLPSDIADPIKSKLRTGLVNSYIQGSMYSSEKQVRDKVIDGSTAIKNYDDLSDRIMSGEFDKNLEQDDKVALVSKLGTERDQFVAKITAALAYSVSAGKDDQEASFRNNGQGDPLYEKNVFELAKITGGEKGDQIINDYNASKEGNLAVYTVNKQIANGDIQKANTTYSNLASTIPTGQGAAAHEIAVHHAEVAVKQALTSLDSDPAGTFWKTPEGGIDKAAGEWSHLNWYVYTKQKENGIKDPYIVPKDLREEMADMFKTKTAEEIRQAIGEFSVYFPNSRPLPDGTPMLVKALSEIQKNPINEKGANPLISLTIPMIMEGDLGQADIVLRGIRSIDDLGTDKVNQRLADHKGTDVDTLKKDFSAGMRPVYKEFSNIFSSRDGNSVRFTNNLTSLVENTAKQLLLENRTTDINKAIAQAKQWIFDSRYDLVNNKVHDAWFGLGVRDSQFKYAVPNNIAGNYLSGDVIANTLTPDRVMSDFDKRGLKFGTKDNVLSWLRPQDQKKVQVGTLRNSLILMNTPDMLGVRVYADYGAYGYQPLILKDGSTIDYRFIDVMKYGKGVKSKGQVKNELRGNSVIK